jgi:hypothetical protein
MANVDDTNAKSSGLAAIDASCAEHLGCFQSLLVTDREKCIKHTSEYITVRLLVDSSRRFEGTLRHILKGQNPRLHRSASLKSR